MFESQKTCTIQNLLGANLKHSWIYKLLALFIGYIAGIISVPIAMKVPKLSESTYSKALEAKVCRSRCGIGMTNDDFCILQSPDIQTQLLGIS